MLQIQINFLMINALLKILCPIVSKGVTYYVKKHIKSSANAFVMWSIRFANNKSLREILGFTLATVLSFVIKKYTT